MRILLSIILPVLFASQGFPQIAPSGKQSTYTFYSGLLAGGCVKNPVSVIAGIRRPLQEHFFLGYDVHVWGTRYEDYDDEVYSKGKFFSMTPSVKLSYYTGKEGKGLQAGLGLGYMFGRDHGTEQHYITDPVTKIRTMQDGPAAQNWDFNSIAPSITLGIGFHVFHRAASVNTVYYFANTSEGFVAAAGGAGFTMSFKKASH